MKDKTPLIRLAKREDMGKGKVWLIRLAAFGVAILIGMIIFAIAGADPIKAYGTMLASSLGKKSGIRQVVKNAVPLLGVGLADVDIKDHIKASFFYVWGFSILCLVFAIMIGLMQF